MNPIAKPNPELQVWFALAIMSIMSIIGSQGLIQEMSFIEQENMDTILYKIDNADFSEGKAKR